MIISRAAIMFSNDVVEGYNYTNIVSLAHKLGFYGDKQHGFTTNNGLFVYPDIAAKIAFKAGQIAEQVDELTPEYIWPEWDNND